MANAKNISLDDPMKVLIYGPSGSKKTILASTFPDPHFVDFDNGMRTLRGRDVNYITVNNRPTNDEDFIELFGEKKAKLSGYEKGVMLIEHWANTLTREQTLIVDSLTFLNDYALAHVLKLQNQKTPRIQDWGATQKLLEMILEQLNNVECNLIIICHEQFTKDEESGIISWLPLTIGKLATKIPVYFDEVWRSYSEQKGGGKNMETLYGIQTVPTRRSTAKSRLNLPTAIVEPSYSKIKALADGKEIG